MNLKDSGNWAPVPIVIALFQAIILVFQWTILTEMRDHESRIRVIEDVQSAMKADRWSKSDQMAHEAVVAARLEAIKEDLTIIKVRLGVTNGK